MQKLFITHPAYNPASITYGFVGKQNSWRVDNREDGTSKQVSFLTQVHGNRCIDINLNTIDLLTEADAQITTEPGVLLAIRTADCVPIVLIDEAQKVVGVAHAGWKGAVSGVIANTIAAMQSKGASNITAIIGPCIRQASYEVRADLRDKVLDGDQFFVQKDRVLAKLAHGSEMQGAYGAQNRSVFNIREDSSTGATQQIAPGVEFCKNSNEEHWLFDLPGYVKHKLHQEGITNVLDVEMDTFTDEDNFWSCRREFLRGRKHDGHVLGIVGIKS